MDQLKKLKTHGGKIPLKLQGKEKQLDMQRLCSIKHPLPTPRKIAVHVRVVSVGSPNTLQA